MRWRAISTRLAADSPPFRDAAPRPFPGLGRLGLELIQLGISNSSLAIAGVGPAGLSPLPFRLFGFRREQQPNGTGGPNSGPETQKESSQRAKPSAPDGVPEDMAT